MKRHGGTFVNIIEKEEEEEKKEEKEKTLPTWKMYVLHDSNSTALWKRQNYGNNKRTSVFWELQVIKS